MNETQIAQQNTAQALANGAFFDHVRKNLFSGSLNQSQVDGINALVLAGVEHGLTVQQHAYVLATAFHETGIVKKLPSGSRVMTRPMQPVRESDRGEGRKYGTWKTNNAGMKYCPKSGGSNAAVYTENECPHLFYGRGHVQLTWYANYERATREINKTLPENEHIDLIKNPDLALDLAISCKVIVLGMAQGWFTGKKLSHYINDQRTDYVSARAIVNGTDQADQIARYARVFETALNLV